MKSDGRYLDVSTFAWCILVSVMDPQCLEALNQARRAWWTSLAGVQSAQVGRVTADLLAVLCDSGQRMWTTVGWFLSAGSRQNLPNLLTRINTAEL